MQGDEAPRVMALASSIRQMVGTFDLDELKRVDALIETILNERHSWARHHGESIWHSVLEYVGGSVVTRCKGRFALDSDYSTCSRPKLAERCEACQDAYLLARSEEFEVEQLWTAACDVPSSPDANGEFHPHPAQSSPAHPVQQSAVVVPDANGACSACGVWVPAGRYRCLECADTGVRALPVRDGEIELPSPEECRGSGEET